MSCGSPHDRPLAIAPRRDLIVREQHYGGRKYWLVKDPLALKYYRFQEEEYALLAWLDGKLTLNELRRKFEERFAPQKISPDELLHFIGQLLRSALVLSDAPAQADRLAAQHTARAAEARKAWWSNPLAIRFRGVNPDRLLTALAESWGWLFSVPIILLACLFGLSALALLTIEFDTFRARLPGFHEFFTWKNWLWLSLTLASVKVLHELGHGIACKRLGGECHEMGFMLLLFSPCLYANVSDAWTLPNKWHRAAIGAAGMYVELILASLAVYVWWLTRPGVVHFIALDVIFVCSVSTLLFNLNPLLKFDGYYILCDLVEVPNLRTKASALVRGTLAAWLLGIPQIADPFAPRRQRWLFASYAFAASIYGWFVTVSILWALIKLCEPFGLKTLGLLLAAALVYASLVRPAARLLKFLLLPGKATLMQRMRGWTSAAVITALAVSLAWLPLPRYVTCAVMVEPQHATAVYVDVAGDVREVLAPPYSLVEPGTPIVRLENIDLEIALARLESEREQMAVRLEALRERSLVDDVAAERVAATEETLAALDAQVQRKHAEWRRLTVVAPQAGLLLPPAPRASDAAAQGRLAVWSGHPLELRNVGAHLATGTVVGQISGTTAMETMLAIDETDIDFVRPGQRVEIILDELPGERLTTRVATLSAHELEFAPDGMAARHGGQLQTHTDQAGREVPASTTYQASAVLDNAQGKIIGGARGIARIDTGRETLGRRVWREVRRTLAWEL